MRPTILVVDDEAAVRFTLAEILGEHNIDVLEACDGQEALDRVRDTTEPIGLIISDLKMPRLDGFGLMDALIDQGDHPPVLIITAHGDERAAVEAMKRGAVDYFKKPFDYNEIMAVVRRNLRMVSLEGELRGRSLLGQNMLLASPAMLQVAQRVGKVAGKNIDVLIVGESGTGKELVADAIVRGSSRRDARFVRFNCGALHGELAQAELFGHAKGAFTGASKPRPGLFREAHGGTLLLDEINSLDPALQVLLLRVLQEKEVRPLGQERTVPIDVRIIATSNEPLQDHPTFRQDLFYRLCVVQIPLPPLRERREEIPILARHFARLYADDFGLGSIQIPPATMTRLQHADWPGNVRQLQHAVQSMVALAEDGVLIEGDPFAQQPPQRLQGLKEQVQAFEARLIAEALTECDGNQSETARQLKINRATLISKMKKYNLA